MHSTISCKFRLKNLLNLRNLINIYQCCRTVNHNYSKHLVRNSRIQQLVLFHPILKLYYLSDMICNTCVYKKSKSLAPLYFASFTIHILILIETIQKSFTVTILGSLWYTDLLSYVWGEASLNLSLSVL